MSLEEFPEHDGARDLVRALRKSKETPFISALQQALLFCSYGFFIHISQSWGQGDLRKTGKQERERRGDENEEKDFRSSEKAFYFYREMF